MRVSDNSLISKVQKPRHGRRMHSRSVGQGAVELCAAMMICVPIVLAGIDLGFIALGSTINDNVCRDAARAAGSGPSAESLPSPAHKVQPNSSPYQRAVAVIRKHSPTDLPMKVMENPEVIETVRDVPPAPMGGAVDGDISVKTTVRITPPFLLKSFLPAGVMLSSRHLVPFTYVVMPPNPPAKPANQ
ncbi:MAG: hypothetical protein SGJ27_26990 [Candidatus Melainabacteria bacterium]|nr:hypothetical protein [Candidatus Melainabacteria bacterium]